MRGPRVILRPITNEDVPSLVRWINDPEITQYVLSYLPMQESEEREWVANLAKRKQTDVVLAMEVNGTFIGTMGIHHINWKDRTATTGTIIGEKEYQNQGYGTEAKRLLLNYAFNRLNLRKILSAVIAFNGRSHKYSLKCGYKEEGRRKAQFFVNGTYWDEILLAVFKEDWLPLWEIFVEKHDMARP